MHIVVVGLGLIGCSMALNLKINLFASQISGIDKNPGHEKEALQSGFIDKIGSEADLKSADLVLVCIPVDATVEMLPGLLDQISPGGFVMDTGSTKAEIIRSVQKHKARRQFIATHPMAGTENSGPSAAIKGLFQNRVAILCNKEESDPEGIKLANQVYRSLGSTVIEMEAASHDEHVGYVSHLSHVISYALAVTVLEKEKSTATLFNLAAGGFASTARLAKSSPSMWAPIFEQNADQILPIIDLYLEKLSDFRNIIAKGNRPEIEAFISKANAIRRVLDKP